MITVYLSKQEYQKALEIVEETFHYVEDLNRIIPDMPDIQESTVETTESIARVDNVRHSILCITAFG